MLTTSAAVLAGLLGAALVLMGGRAFTTPQAAVGFGIPDTPADDPAFRPWLRVKGLREIACGVFVFVLMLVATTSLLGWYVLALAAIPAGDAVVVLRSGGPKAAAYASTAQRRWRCRRPASDSWSDPPSRSDPGYEAPQACSAEVSRGRLAVLLPPRRRPRLRTQPGPSSISDLRSGQRRSLLVDDGQGVEKCGDAVRTDPHRLKNDHRFSSANAQRRGHTKVAPFLAS